MWAKEHVDDFNTILERQLSSVESNGETYKACMDQAKMHAALLNEVGIDFRNLVGRRRKDSVVFGP